MKKKDWLVIIIIACATFLITYFGSSIVLKENKKEEKVIKQTSSFTIKFIKEVNSNNKNTNYIISPYSVEMALSMLSVGADNDTLIEFDKVLKDRSFNLDNDKVSVANALFIKNYYKDVIEKDFSNTLTDNYNSEVLIDDFTTPDVINNWVKDKTNGMIPKILDEINPEFVLGIANAVAIDTKWKNQFKCIYTDGEEFKNDKKTLKVEMMHNDYEGGVKYLDKDVKGIVLPYKDNLEYVAIMPKKDLHGFIDNLTDKSLNEYLNSFKKVGKNEKVILDLPRYSYEYDVPKFKNILMNMGIKKAFDKDNADFSKIITKENLNKLEKGNIYVSTALHKAKIELNEKGTKAAAVTYFALESNTAMEVDETKLIEIKFNKPFMYIIRDKESHEMLFFGTVYEPNKWKGSTCEGGDKSE